MPLEAERLLKIKAGRWTDKTDRREGRHWHSGAVYRVAGASITPSIRLSGMDSQGLVHKIYRHIDICLIEPDPEPPSEFCIVIPEHQPSKPFGRFGARDAAGCGSRKNHSAD